MTDIEHLYNCFVQSTGVTTDTRKCREGMMFVALKGNTFDGNCYAQSALEQGCTFAVIDNADYADPADKRIILVEDTLKALQQLAHHHRKQLGTPIVGITGTNGKTTTKELVAAVLKQRYNVLYTQGNLNNHIGVPLTLLGLTREHDMAIIEMGANHPGDIKELVEIAEPDYGLITNVGMAHLQGFGSLEGVIRTKGELYDYLRTTEQRTIFMNINDKHLAEIAEGLTVVGYGQYCPPHANEKEEGINVLGICCASAPNRNAAERSPYLRFQWKQQGGVWHEVATRLIGNYNIDNALCAIAVGCHFGIPEEAVTEALEAYVPQNNRSQLTRTKRNTLVVDAYNANPTSMKAAIDNFAQMDMPCKMAILGDMKELGTASAEAHQEVVERLAACAFDEVWLVGEAFAQTTHTQRTFADAEEVKAALTTECPEGRTILIKGSNSMKLASLVPYL